MCKVQVLVFDKYISAPVGGVVGVRGGSVQLPCPTNTSTLAQGKEDRATLVLWFRDQNLHPFYT